jgi:uncharacterized membrane protein
MLFDTTQLVVALLWIAGAFALAIALIPLLGTLPPRGRFALISVVTFIAGLFFAAEFFLPVGEDDKNILTDPFQKMQGSLQVITALSLGLGTYGLVRLHLRNAVQRRAQWGYSLVLLVAFVVMAFFSVWNTMAEKGLFGLERTPLLENAFTLLFDYTLIQLDATMFSLIAFYIFSAAYRAFRIRSIEASILMFTAMLVMIGIVPLGKLISDSIGLPAVQTAEMRTNPFMLENILYNLRLPQIASWIQETLNAPVQRAIEFGVGIGALAMAIRLWLSLERGIN